MRWKVWSAIGRSIGYAYGDTYEEAMLDGRETFGHLCDDVTKDYT